MQEVHPTLPQQFAQDKSVLYPLGSNLPGQGANDDVLYLHLPSRHCALTDRNIAVPHPALFFPFLLIWAAGADAHMAGRLAFFGEIEDLGQRKAFTAHLAPLQKKKWFVYAKPPFAGPEGARLSRPLYTPRR